MKIHTNMMKGAGRKSSENREGVSLYPNMFGADAVLGLVAASSMLMSGNTTGSPTLLFVFGERGDPVPENVLYGDV
jgi:hypothetical protein